MAHEYRYLLNFSTKKSTFIYNSEGIIDLIEFTNNTLEQLEMHCEEINFILSFWPKSSTTSEGSDSSPTGDTEYNTFRVG